ncbi:type III-A CRISPR-associated RAMP protein Csm4 [Emticicia sp. 17c]|uniref:type III-A CRISPR-associated RAMP protein Csm4 n=1 Tax=Emticicia sp. 17c TaxID=3127704 RepID=UPI00301BE652
MKALILESKPYSQYHFGEYSIDETRLNHTSEVPHADTLYSAIINVYNQNFDDTDDFVTMLDLTDFEMSSACYCLNGNGTYIFFLPKPLVLNTMVNDSANYKTQKKITYVSKGVWEKGFDLNNISSEELCLLGDKFLCLNKELKAIKPNKIKQKFWPEITLSSVSYLTKTQVHTEEQTGTLYVQANIQIQDLQEFDISVHFYFLLKHKLDAETASKLDLVLSLLPETGIGGERSVGCGTFGSISVQEFEIKPLDPAPDTFSNVSMIAPVTEDELKRIRYYSTTLRGGRRLGGDNDPHENTLKQVRMVREGALIEHNQPIGHNPSIKPASTTKDEYLRFGKGFLLPIHKNWTKQWQD